MKKIRFETVGRAYFPKMKIHIHARDRYMVRKSLIIREGVKLSPNSGRFLDEDIMTNNVWAAGCCICSSPFAEFQSSYLTDFYEVSSKISGKMVICKLIILH